MKRTFRHLASWVLGLHLVGSASPPAWAAPAEAAAAVEAEAPPAPWYLFTSFRGNGEDGLHLALSRDGYRWTAVNGDRSLLRSDLGAKLMRDPCVARGPDGRFHLVWTTGWTAESGKVLGYAHSEDLIRWSAPRAIEVMQDEPRTRNLWAPELFYDAAQGRWLVFWSSTIPGRFADTDATGDDGYNHRAYYVTTPDFGTFSAAKLLYDPGFNCIDATMFMAGGKYHLIFKDERKNPVKKNLRHAVADRAEGPYGPPSGPFTRDWVEGPSVLRIGEWTYVYFDHYARPHYYGAVRSKDLRTWEDVSTQMSFPRDHRHGTGLAIPAAVAEALAALGAAAGP